jgi:putative ABC transport system ATP-binding protein
MSETVVQTFNLAREYKRGKIPVPALNGVDLRIEKGEIVGIIGPSGSGKTTLLNLIGGLDRPTRGKVVVDQVDLSELNDAQLSDYRLRKIGFVFQFYNLISTLTALQNVQLPMSLANVSKSERNRRALELLGTVGLESRIDHVPDELSGGEQQRVAIARALANGPSVILADEPTGDLDSKSAKSLMELIESLKKNGHVTFVVVTHDPIVVTGCDRAYAVRDGKITHELAREANLKNGKLGDNNRAMMDIMY